MTASPAARPFRFGILQMSVVDDAGQWADQVRRVEDSGFSTLLLSDHFERSPLGPIPAMAHAAGLTSRLHVGSLVLNNDMRHPALLAKELATIDLLSGGRVEIGLGAGWMLADYDQAGLTIERAGIRVDRLTEAVDVLLDLFEQPTVDHHGTHYTLNAMRPVPPPGDRRPPLLIGGGGRRVLALAARRADIVSVNWNVRAGVVGADALATGTPAATDDKVSWVRQQAGDRTPELHLQCYLLRLTDDPLGAAAEWLAALGVSEVDPAQAVACPHVLVGSLEAVEEKLLARRERWGFSYVSFYDSAMEDAARITARLSGR